MRPPASLRLTARGLTFVVGLAALAIPGSAPLAAQDTLTAGAGSRIRLQVDAADAWRVGTLAAVRADTMFVRPCAFCARLAYPHARVTALDVSLGRPNRAGRGALVGAIAGAAVIVVSVSRCHDGGEGPPCALGYVGLPVAALAGTLVGGVVGSYVPAGPERWRPARVASAAVRR